MAERGPWSVKGIDQRARQAARDAARLEGITLGEYLNKLILEESHDGPPDTFDDDLLPNARDIRAGAASTLDQLARRVEAVEARSTLAITGIDQSVLGLLTRLEKTETGQSAIAGHVDTLIDELRETHAALSEKVRHLEQDDGPERNLEALKSLEDALGKLASHVYEEGARTQEEGDAIRGRVEAGFEDLDGRVASMETRVESTLSEAAQRVEKAVEAAELRAEGTTKHLSERFTNLENRVTERLAGVEPSNDRLDKVESDVSGAIDSMEQTMLRIQDRLNRAETTTDAALKSLESTFDSLDQRINAVAANVDPDAADALRNEIEKRFEGLADELKGEIDSARSEMARQIAETATSEGFEALSDSVEAMRTQLDAGESRHTEAFDTIGDQVSRISESFEKRLQTLEESADGDDGAGMVHLTEEVGKVADQLEARVRETEEASARAIEQVGEQVAGMAQRLQLRQDEALSRLSADIADTRNQSDTRLSEAFDTVSERLDRIQAEASGQISPVQRAIASLADRLDQVEGGEQRPQDLPTDDADELLMALSAVTETAPVEAAPASDLVEHSTVEDAVADDEFEPGLPDWPAAESSESDEDYTPKSAEEAAPSETFDPLDELSSWSEDADDLGASEVRDGDIFDPDSNVINVELPDGENDEQSERLPPAHLDLEREMPRAARELDEVTGLEEDADAADYIARARRAALKAAQTNGASAQTLEQKSTRSRLPLYAAASVVVLTAAGATAYQSLRGKQSPDQPIQAESSMSAPAAPAVATPTEQLAAPSQVPEATDAEASRPVETVEAASTSAGEAEEPALTLAASTVASSEAPAPAQMAPESITISPVPPPFTLETAAAAGDRVALFQLGEERITASDFAMGANLIRKAAEAGMPAAQYRLAKLHEKGLGVPRDLAAARNWTERAASGGNIKAMHDIAVFHADGEGGPQSYARSAEWFSRAAEYGVVDSQYNLGVLYQEGLGITPDAGEALFWFTVAASLGDSGAPTMATQVRQRVPQDEVDAILQRASTWDAAEPSPAANGEFGSTPWNRFGPPHIRAVQSALNALGYEAGIPDGVTGPTTTAAIRRYQADAGLTVTGTVNSELVNAINALSSGA